MCLNQVDHVFKPRLVVVGGEVVTFDLPCCFPQFIVFGVFNASIMVTYDLPTLTYDLPTLTYDLPVSYFCTN